MSTIRMKDGGTYDGNKTFAGMGIVRWCAVCGKHRAQLGGGLRHIMGMRMWVCQDHKVKK